MLSWTTGIPSRTRSCHIWLQAFLPVRVQSTGTLPTDKGQTKIWSMIDYGFKACVDYIAASPCCIPHDRIFNFYKFSQVNLRFPIFSWTTGDFSKTTSCHAWLQAFLPVRAQSTGRQPTDKGQTKIWSIILALWRGEGKILSAIDILQAVPFLLLYSISLTLPHVVLDHWYPFQDRILPFLATGLLASQG